MARVWIFFLVNFLGLSAYGSEGPHSVGMSSQELPAELQGIGIEEQLGATLRKDWEFTNSDGRRMTLGDLLLAEKPIILSLVYYNCPGLCSLHLNGALEVLNNLQWKIGQEFYYLTVSFDPKEGPDLAHAKRQNYINLYKHPQLAEKGWFFVTAEPGTIEELTRLVGFKYKFGSQNQEWMHASALIFLSPSGVVTRYLHGVLFEPEQVKLALNEAIDGKLGSPWDKLIWYCYRYDPKQSKYVVYAFRLVQIGGGLIVVLLALILIPTWRREL